MQNINVKQEMQKLVNAFVSGVSELARVIAFQMMHAQLGAVFQETQAQKRVPQKKAERAIKQVAKNHAPKKRSQTAAQKRRQKDANRAFRLRTKVKEGGNEAITVNEHKWLHAYTTRVRKASK